jgi:GNAT superfamily N-acetyltransferase
MPLHGAERENSYIVQDMAGVELGQGWLQAVVDRENWPDRPLRLALYMDAHPAARDTLYGALMARAGQLYALYGRAPGCVTARCHPNDIQLLYFYQQMGFDTSDGEELFQWDLAPDEKPFFPPIGTQMVDTLLSGREDMAALLARVNRYSDQPHEIEWLLEAADLPYFMACGVYNGTDCLGEALVTGAEGEASLEMLYTVPAWRRHHVATALLLGVKAQLIRRGARVLRVRQPRSNRAAVAMMQLQGFVWMGTLEVRPTKDIP